MPTTSTNLYLPLSPPSTLLPSIPNMTYLSDTDLELQVDTENIEDTTPETFRMFVRKKDYHCLQKI